MFAETAELAVRISLKDNVSAGVRGLQRNLAGLNGSLGRVGRGVGQIGTGLARAGLLVGGAAITGIAAAAKAAADFEDAFAGVRKTVEASETELATLSDQFRNLARTIPIPVTEFARLGEVAGALGIHVSDIDEFVEVTAKLGVTTDLTADQAADALGRIANILNLTADDFDNFGSALVNLGNKGASTEDEIIEITRRVAAAGQAFGLATPEILGLAEATASFTGLQPERAGSSLVRLLEGLTLVAAKGGKRFKLLNAFVGTDFKKAIQKDASGALTLFLGKLAKLDRFERLKLLRDLGISGTGLSQLVGGLSANVDDLTTSFKNADAGWQGNFLNEEAAKKFDTLKQQVITLRNNIIDAGISIGEGMLPALKRATEKLIKFLQIPENQTALKNLGKDIGAAIDKIDWKAVLDGAKSFVGVMKGALDFVLLIASAVDKLPAQIKAAGLGFIALNKLSGGLIGAGVGNVVGGLAGAATRGIAARIPGVGAVFAQPVYVTNWPIGGLGGGGRGGFPPVVGAGGGAAGAAVSGFLAPGFITALSAVAVPIIMADVIPLMFRRETAPPTIQGAQGVTLAPGETTTNMILQGSPNFYNLVGQAVQNGVSGVSFAVDQTTDAVETLRGAFNMQQAKDQANTERIVAAQLRTVNLTDAVRQATDSQKQQFGTKLDRIAALDSTANAKLSQIAAKRQSVNVTTVNRLYTTVKVSARDVQRSKVLHDSYVSKMTNAGIY